MLTFDVSYIRSRVTIMKVVRWYRATIDPEVEVDADRRTGTGDVVRVADDVDRLGSWAGSTVVVEASSILRQWGRTFEIAWDNIVVDQASDVAASCNSHIEVGEAGVHIRVRLARIVECSGG
jgi:hypothetical protein